MRGGEPMPRSLSAHESGRRSRPRPRSGWQRRPEKRVRLGRDLPMIVALAALALAVLLALARIALR